MPSQEKNSSDDYLPDAKPDKINNDRLKVGFVFDDSLDGSDGVAQQVKTLGSWLSHQGHDVSYLVGETKLKQWAGGRVYSLARNQPVIFNANRLSVPLPANRKHIKKVLNAHQFDVLHVQMPHSPFMAGRVVKAAGRRTAIIGTFHIVPHGWLASVGSYLLRLIYGRSLRLFDQIVSVSQPAALFAKKGYRLNSQVVPNMIDLARFKQSSESIKNQPNLIVFLGRLVKRKGCLELIRAFDEVYHSNPAARLIIAGDGPERRQLESYAHRHGLNAAVELRGYLKEEDKPELLAKATVACFPSTGGESFGVVLIEAMAASAGVVLAGNNEGYASVLGAQPQLLVDPRQTDVLAARLARLLQDKDLVSKLHVWQKVEIEKYDVEQIGPQVLNIYQRAIAKRRSTGHN